MNEKAVILVALLAVVSMAMIIISYDSDAVTNDDSEEGNTIPINFESEEIIVLTTTYKMEPILSSESVVKEYKSSNETNFKIDEAGIVTIVPNGTEKIETIVTVVVDCNEIEYTDSVKLIYPGSITITSDSEFALIGKAVSSATEKMEGMMDQIEYPDRYVSTFESLIIDVCRLDGSADGVTFRYNVDADLDTSDWPNYEKFIVHFGENGLDYPQFIVGDGYIEIEAASFSPFMIVFYNDKVPDYQIDRDNIFMNGAEDIIVESQDGTDSDTNLKITYTKDGEEKSFLYNGTAARIHGGYNHPGTLGVDTSNDFYSITVKSGKLQDVLIGSKGRTDPNQNTLTMVGGTINVEGGDIETVAAAWYYCQSMTGTFTVNMIGGKVGTIYGGGETSYVASDEVQENIDISMGNESYHFVPTYAVVDINVSGGTVGYVYGSGRALTQSGNSAGYSMITEKVTIDITGGEIDYVNGGGFNGPEGNWSESSGQDSTIVNDATITISGGTVNNVFGGGYNGQWKWTHKMSENGLVISNYNGEKIIDEARNRVNKVTINVEEEADITNLYAGGRSYAHVDESIINVNGGTVGTLSASGNYGYVDETDMNVTGGVIGKIELVTRNYVGDIDLNVTGGTVEEFYAGTGGAYKNSNLNESSFNISTIDVLGNVNAYFTKNAEPTYAYLTTGLEKTSSVDINIPLTLLSMDLKANDGYTGNESVSGTFIIENENAVWNATVDATSDGVSFEVNSNEESGLTVIRTGVEVASVNAQNYDDIIEALEIWTFGGGELKLLSNVIIQGPIDLTGKTATLDLGGYSLVATGQLIWMNDTDLTIQNGKIITYDGSVVYADNDATDTILKINNVTVTSTVASEESMLIVDDLTMTQCTISALDTPSDGIVKIRGTGAISDSTILTTDSVSASPLISVSGSLTVSGTGSIPNITLSDKSSSVSYANGIVSNVESSVTGYKLESMVEGGTTTCDLIPISYTVVFNGNSTAGITGIMENQTFTFDTENALTPNSFTRSGYTFAGWNTVADGSGTSYTDGATVKNLTSEDGGVFTLYAQWTRNYVPPSGGGGTVTPPVTPDEPETDVEKHPDGSTTETTTDTTTNPDGSKTESTTVTEKDPEGNVTGSTVTETTTSEKEEDGVKETVTSTTVTTNDAEGNKTGSTSTSTTTTVTSETTTVTEKEEVKDADDKVTSSTEKVTETTKIDGGTVTSETTEVKDAAGNVTSSTESIRAESDDGNVRTEAVTESGTTTVNTTVSVPTSGQVDDSLIQQAVAQSDAVSEKVSAEAPDRVIQIGTGSGMDITLSPESMSAIADTGAEFKVISETGSMQLDSDVVGTLTEPGEDVTVRMAESDDSDLTEAQQSAKGDRFGVTLTATVGTDRYHLLGGTVTVTIPYTESMGADPGSLGVFYIDEDGVRTFMESVYDQALKSFVFQTDHFSLFVVDDLPAADDDNTMLYAGIAAVVVVIVVAAAAILHRKH